MTLLFAGDWSSQKGQGGGRVCREDTSAFRGRQGKRESLKLRWGILHGVETLPSSSALDTQGLRRKWLPVAALPWHYKHLCSQMCGQVGEPLPSGELRTLTVRTSWSPDDLECRGAPEATLDPEATLRMETSHQGDDGAERQEPGSLMLRETPLLPWAFHLTPCGQKREVNIYFV